MLNLAKIYFNHMNEEKLKIFVAEQKVTHMPDLNQIKYNLKELKKQIKENKLN